MDLYVNWTLPWRHEITSIITIPVFHELTFPKSTKYWQREEVTLRETARRSEQCWPVRVKRGHYRRLSNRRDRSVFIWSENLAVKGLVNSAPARITHGEVSIVEFDIQQWLHVWGHNCRVRICCVIMTICCPCRVFVHGSCVSLVHKYQD